MFWANVIKEGITLISGIEQNQSRVTVEQAMMVNNGFINYLVPKLIN